MADVIRYRLDDLRRFATELGAKAGMNPARASALASHLLWYDSAGARSVGFETLPGWLDRIEAGEIDPQAEGEVAGERLGTAVFDGANGIPALILARAGELAIEKARDAGVGLVRVRNLVATGAGPAAGIAAEMAIGPVVAAVLGPGPAWSLAVPGAEGLPAVFDSALEFDRGTNHKPGRKNVVRSAKPAPSTSPASPLWLPWASGLIPDGGWLVAAIGIKAVESLSAFHERVASAMSDVEEVGGRLLPLSWERRRRDAREHGITVTTPAWNRLIEWSHRLDVPLPSPAAPVSSSVGASRGAT